MKEMIFEKDKEKVAGNIFCLLIVLLLCSFLTHLFAQQTNNLEVMWVKLPKKSNKKDFVLYRHRNL